MTADRRSTRAEQETIQDGRLRARIEDVRTNYRVETALLAVVVAVWTGLYLRGLGDLPIRVWDESRYATPARLMVEGGGWLDPAIRVNTHSEGLGLGPRLSKPPLLYWLQATAMALFGVSEFAARLPTALASLGCAILVFYVGQRTYDRGAGLAGAFALLAFPGLLLGSHGGRAAVPDTALALFGSCFVWLTWRGRSRPKLLVPAGVFAGLAVMTKGIAAGVFVVILAPVVAYFWRSYLNRYTVGAVAATVLVALPWHLYAWLAHGDTFVEQYFVQAVASRVAGDLTGPTAEPIFGFMNYPYFRFAFRLFLPPYQYALPVYGVGVILALVTVWRLVGRDGPGAHRGKVLLVWWTLAVPLTFALGGGNHAWYLIPMYVPAAVLIGYVPVAMADRLLGGSVLARLGSLGGNRDIAGSIPGGRSPAGRTVLATGLGIVIVLVLLGTYGAPLNEPYNAEQRGIGQEIAREVPAGETVYVAEEGVARQSLMSLSFYANRPLERAGTDRLATDAAIEYAILPLGARDEIDRSSRVIARGPENDVVVVRFGDR